MEHGPLSAKELQRLKRKRAVPAFQQAFRSFRRPPRDWRQRLRWFSVGLRESLRRGHQKLPRLLTGGFLFALCLWFAVFAVAAAVISTPAVPRPWRYGTGVVALVYLLVHALLARMSGWRRSTAVLETLLDAAAAASIFLMSARYVSYAHLLLFFAAARIASRYRDVRILPVGLLLLVPFSWAQAAPLIGTVLEGFAVLVLMLIVVHLFEVSVRAQRAAHLPLTLAAVTSSVARAADEESLLNHLANLSPPLAEGCAWAFWVRDGSGEFRVQRWFGLPGGERPVNVFTPNLGDHPGDAVEMTGPMPGTSFGEKTLVQPMVAADSAVGLITIAGPMTGWNSGQRDLIRSVAEVAAVALARLRTIGDQRTRAEAMEIANRLAGRAAARAGDQEAILRDLLPELRRLVGCESLHLEWAGAGQLESVVAAGDPVHPFVPARFSIAGTRAEESLKTWQPVVEPVTGRRPEDGFWTAAAIRHLVVLPMRCVGIEGTLQAGRREARAFSDAEVTLLQFLVERLALVFGAGGTPSPDPAPVVASRFGRLAMET